MSLGREPTGRREGLWRVYAHAVAATASMLRLWPEGKRPSVTAVKRLVQDLVGAVERDAAALVAVTEIKVSPVASHLVNTAVIAVAMAHRMGLDRPSLVRVGMVALLHELGVVDLPKPLVASSAGLSTADAALLARLPLYNVRRLLELDTPGAVAAERAVAVFEARAHVGGGPPFRQTGTRDLIAEIVAVADSFDDLTSSRLGHAALRPEQALETLRASDAAKLDPLVVKLLVDTVGQASRDRG